MGKSDVEVSQKKNETKMGSSQKWTEKTMLVLELATYTGSVCLFGRMNTSCVGHFLALLVRPSVSV